MAGRQAPADWHRFLYLSAGGLHAGGALALAGLGTTPGLTGRIAADTLPLPVPALGATEPIAFGMLRGWQAEVKLEAAQVLADALPVLRQAQARLVLADGTLRLEGLTARLGGGALTATASADATATPPVVTLQARLDGVAPEEGTFGLPLDIASGGLAASLAFTAAGHSPAALASTLAGRAHLEVSTDGTLAGASLGDISGGARRGDGACGAGRWDDAVHAAGSGAGGRGWSAAHRRGENWQRRRAVRR